MFEKINYKDIQNYIFERLSSEGALLVIGNKENHNNMTIGWATHGVLWSKDVFITYVKPTRYTFNYANKCDTFAICYFDSKDDLLKICGTTSGRDVNKDELCNLHSFEIDNTIGYLEASIIITCKKIYQDEFKKDNFIDLSIYDKRYLDNLAHHFYIGEVVNIYKKK